MTPESLLGVLCACASVLCVAVTVLVVVFIATIIKEYFI